jgi:hypothetical protein
LPLRSCVKVISWSTCSSEKSDFIGGISDSGSMNRGL